MESRIEPFVLILQRVLRRRLVVLINNGGHFLEMYLEMLALGSTMQVASNKVSDVDDPIRSFTPTKASVENPSNKDPNPSRWFVP